MFQSFSLCLNSIEIQGRGGYSSSVRHSYVTGSKQGTSGDPYAHLFICLLLLFINLGFYQWPCDKCSVTPVPFISFNKKGSKICNLQTTRKWLCGFHPKVWLTGLLSCSRKLPPEVCHSSVLFMWYSTAYLALQSSHHVGTIEGLFQWCSIITQKTPCLRRNSLLFVPRNTIKSPHCLIVSWQHAYYIMLFCMQRVVMFPAFIFVS